MGCLCPGHRDGCLRLSSQSREGARRCCFGSRADDAVSHWGALEAVLTSDVEGWADEPRGLASTRVSRHGTDSVMERCVDLGALVFACYIWACRLQRVAGEKGWVWMAEASCCVVASF